MCQNWPETAENWTESIELPPPRENEHSTSIEIVGPNGLCKVSGVPDLPEARGKLCAAYDPAGAVIVCGGGERFWRPNANCWQLVAGDTGTWREIPQVIC